MSNEIIEIDGKLISPDLKSKQFICDLNVCKGACCVEGDNGAPLEKKELEEIDRLLEEVKPYISEKGLQVIEQIGAYQYNKKENTYNTSLIDEKACVFISQEKGMTVCGIEKAYNDGKINFKKPISCHLYPIRITKLKNHEALNYEQWDICSAACLKGTKEKVPVYQFLKEALIRKYGKLFFATLEFAFRDKED